MRALALLSAESVFAADTTAGFDRDAAPSDLQFLTDENIAEIGQS